VFLNSDFLLLLLELQGGGGGGGLKVSVQKNIFFWVCRFGIIALFLRLFCFWVVCVCVFCVWFAEQSDCVVLFVLCWFVEQLNCAVLFWFPEQVNCVLCESRERHREEVKVAFSVESAPTLFFLFFGGRG
jgi:hypothetical protein